MTSLPPAGQELLDDLGAPPELVRASLRDIALANRWFGGIAAARYGLARLLHGAVPGHLVLLDIGTGSGDLPRALAAWLARRGVGVACVGLERHPVAARVAARDGALVVARGDGLALPLRDRAVDVTLLSQVAHHHPPEIVARLAVEATRVSRIGVVIADLRPARGAALGFRVASRVLGFDRTTRADGVISLRRGFRSEALARLLASAGIAAAVVERPGARIVAYWRSGP
jgi:SAM-dependent methyltransferase